MKNKSSRLTAARLITNSAISLAAIAAMLVFLEGAVRLFDGSSRSADAQGAGISVVRDPELGWRLPPDQQKIVSTTEYHVLVATNSQGWRDIEHRIEKPVGTFRILILGDSVIEAIQVDLEKHFGRQLERLLQGSGYSQVEVILMGVRAYGTLQEYRVFTGEGVLYKPDLVLVELLPSNDLDNNSREIEGNPRGLGEIVARPYLVKTGQDGWDTLEPDFDKAEKARAEVGQRPFWEKSALYNLGRRAFVRTPNREYLIDLCQEAPQYTRSWEITAEIMRRFKASVKDSGGEMIVFVTPATFQYDPSVKEAALKAIPDPSDFCFDDAPSHQRADALLHDLGIAALDLLPAFQQATEQGEALHFENDPHPTAEGHLLIAKELTRFLEENGYLPDLQPGQK